MVSTSLLLAPLLPVIVRAANDWSTPCFNGVCSYESGDGVNTAYGSLTLSGDPTSISDITPASGWQILDCDSDDAEGQSIRLVCTSSDMSANGCGHVFEGGSEHTIIRLPESCSKGPFARVQRTWISEDQSIPDSVMGKLRRRAGETPQVHALAFDFNFADIPPENGNVSLAASATNIPGDTVATTPPPPAARRSRAVRPTISKRGFISDFINKVKQLTTFSEDGSKDLPPIDFSKNIPILDKSISCPQSGAIPAFDGKLHVDVDAKMHAVVTFGYAVTGTVVPPHIDDLGVFAALNANADATFNIQASATGTLDSGLIPLFQTGLPGLSFPGIIDIGPSFSVNAQGVANLGAQANIVLGASWKLDNAKIVFPPKQGGSEGSAENVQAPLKLSVTPSAEITGDVTAHIIPRIDLGVDIIKGLAKATIFAQLDASGKIDMQVKANAAASTGTAGSSASAGVDGCVDISANFAMKAGADADLKPFFDKTASVDVFNINKDLFKKCFGASASTKRSEINETKPLFSRRRALPAPVFKKRDATCPTSGLSLVSLLDQVV